jgi:hypothetical protein
MMRNNISFDSTSRDADVGGRLWVLVDWFRVCVLALTYIGASNTVFNRRFFLRYEGVKACDVMVSSHCLMYVEIKVIAEHPSEWVAL